MEILNTIRSVMVAMVFAGSFLLAAGSKPHSTYDGGKVCAGSNTRLHISGSARDRYNSYLAKYENCETLDDNLEIVYLEGDKDGGIYDYDMSFLESIRVVNGYVLIYGNVFETLPLKNLRLIRGRTLYTPMNSNEGYSLYVASNYRADAANRHNIGLKEIHMTSLHEILDGDVLFERNNLLCYAQTINWDDILSNGNSATFKPTPNDQYKRECEECHASCAGNCWGSTAGLCQQINSLTCTSNCENSCFGPHATQCCHTQCAGGCQGDRNSCWLCRHLSNDGDCVERCPEEKIYNSKTYKYEPNPNARYIYGTNCVKECPSHKLIEDGACVSKCGDGSMAGNDRKCKKCEDGVCPKICSINVTTDYYIGSRSNVSKFEGCTIIEGYLMFAKTTFEEITNITELNAFESVREITEYLLVQGNTINFTSLSFLRNLRIIHGRTLSGQRSVIITNTSLEEFGLSSLREVSHGNIVIANNGRLKNLGLVSLETVGKGAIRIINNPLLCYVDTINWTQIVKNNQFSVKNHANQTEYCEPNGFVCSAQCSSDDGCWGNTDDDCRSCANNTRFGRTCVNSCEFRSDLYSVIINGSKECKRCDDQCLDGCTGEGPDKCLACRNVKDGNFCLENCPPMMFASETGDCEPCYENCKTGCSGNGTHLGPGGCSECQLMMELDIGRNVCMASDYVCPENFYRHSLRLDHSIYTGNETHLSLTNSGHSQEVCSSLLSGKSSSSEQTKVNVVVPVVVVGVIVLGLVAVLVIFLRRQLAKSEENKLRITARINGLDVEEIITPSDVKPDVSVLRLIKESELRRGNVIGSGAFGTVFKGIWIPNAENVKIPVAVKVLTESSNASLNVELLEEARIMASVNHPCCIRILAVCMTSQMMLVTPLMPHGSLLDYVRKNRGSIGSSALLKWSAQIAKGMKYLEERGIVHRDLAARNVLVQGPGQVRITDFGLAKLLNYNEEQYKATGGKMPIKWLALESIEHCIFTHKSDVWSYGVTLWELFTYGERPYEGIKAVDMIRHLEMGERLSQPAICTIDVYMVMIKCWMVDADSRPTFSDLETDFTKMTKDPGRYLVILGDRFMRLQSVVEDVNPSDWFRALSMPEEDGPEKLVTADEYLRPQDLLQGSHPLGLHNMTSISEENNYENSCNRELSLDTSSTSSQTEEDFRFIGLERAAAAKKLNSSSSMKGRYCKQNSRQMSDPGQEDEKAKAAGSKISTPDKGSGPNELKKTVSTDEPDYLEPRNSALLPDGPTYLDVVDDSVVPKVKQSQSPTGIVENPEYLLQNDACSNSPEKDSTTRDGLRDPEHSQRLSDNYSYMRMT